MFFMNLKYFLNVLYVTDNYRYKTIVVGLSLTNSKQHIQTN
jgi:hypothetical protein